MEERKYVCNEQGVCPVCGAHSLMWGDSDFTGDYIGYSWECEECHAQGTEWYKMVFDGHEVDVETQTEEGYSEYNYDNVNDYIAPLV